LSTEEAWDYTRYIETSWTTAQANIKKAQKVIQEQANRYCQEPDFGLKDKIWITTKNWKTDRPSCKLNYQIAGLYKILEKVEYIYQV
jgi:hypothetical protein